MNSFKNQLYKMWMKAFWQKINDYLDDLNISKNDKKKIITEIWKEKWFYF